MRTLQIFVLCSGLLWQGFFDIALASERDSNLQLGVRFQFGASSTSPLRLSLIMGHLHQSNREAEFNAELAGVDLDSHAQPLNANLVGRVFLAGEHTFSKAAEETGKQSGQ